MSRILFFLAFFGTGITMILFPMTWRNFYAQMGQPAFLQKTFAGWSLNVYRVIGIVILAFGTYLVIDITRQHGW
jgi:uncharacterized protein YjeT (DUF2065 family)